MSKLTVRPGQNGTVSIVRRGEGENEGGEEQGVADVTVTVNDGCVQVFVARWEGVDLPVKVTVI